MMLIELRCSAPGWAEALVNSALAWEAVLSTSLLTCKSYGNCCSSVLFACTLSVSLARSLYPLHSWDVTVWLVYRGRAARAAAAAAVGRNARSPEELQWRHILTSCLLLLLSSPTPLLPTHSYFCLHAHVPLPMPGHRAQGQSRVEEDSAQLQPVSRGHGLAYMEHRG